ncbi:LamG-like jellyroll fold domain-containing protein [Streptosporangium sp. NPDC023825]|uniref:LamG-like jellyroll fold domain-containing protein n=1 Tax=Streptosporangium sp. NPDC023825 TaxID=3154909 RepID=UPI0034246B1C
MRNAARRRRATEFVSPWSEWRQVVVDVTHPGDEPLAQTAGPVIRTDQSFTVSAWLQWNDKDGTYTVLDQKDGEQAPFRLGNDAEQGLLFTFTNADDPGTQVEGVLSGTEAPAAEWFHLTGTYDAATRAATLRLNGTPIGTPLLLIRRSRDVQERRRNRQGTPPAGTRLWDGHGEHGHGRGGAEVSLIFPSPVFGGARHSAGTKQTE